MTWLLDPLTPPKPGEIVRCRDRQWVVVPAETPETLCLRPLDGNESETCGIHQALWIGGDPAGQNTQADPAADPAANALDRLEPDRFPQPTPDDVGIGNFESARLLADAVRLNLRSGAGPFRCLGRLSVRLRPYQVVPLLMALRQETVRLLIADDVGIGKTIEAGVIVRELLDRREIDRMAVLCPPQLCDQWRRELQEKFHIEAVVV